LLVKLEGSCAHYWNQYDKTKQTNKVEWIVTGDESFQVKDDYDQYAGRADDIPKSGGIWVSRVGGENTLSQHSVALRAATVGHEDNDRRIKPQAMMVLIQGATALPALEDELKGLVKGKIAP
jgi:benzoate-CoA ligase